MNVDKKMRIFDSYKRYSYYNAGESYSSLDLWPGWYKTFNNMYINIWPCVDNEMSKTVLKDDDQIMFTTYEVKKRRRHTNYWKSCVSKTHGMFCDEDTTLEDVFEFIRETDGVIICEKITNYDFLEEAW